MCKKSLINRSSVAETGKREEMLEEAVFWWQEITDIYLACQSLGGR